MKTPFSLKRAQATMGLVIVSLFAGYAIGYERGAREEQRNWWATAQLDSSGNRVFLGPPARGATHAPSLTRQNPISSNLVK